MPRQSVIAFRFVVEGAIPFDPADLDDYNRAATHLLAIEHAMAPHGVRRMTAKVTTRPMPPAPVTHTAEPEKLPFSEPHATTMRTVDPPDIPPELDRTKS